MTYGLETEWDYSGRKGRDGQQKKIGNAKEKKEKVKRGKDEEVNGQGGKRGVRSPAEGLLQSQWSPKSVRSASASPSLRAT